MEEDIERFAAGTGESQWKSVFPFCFDRVDCWFRPDGLESTKWQVLVYISSTRRLESIIYRTKNRVPIPTCSLLPRPVINWIIYRKDLWAADRQSSKWSITGGEEETVLHKSLLLLCTYDCISWRLASLQIEFTSEGLYIYIYFFFISPISTTVHVCKWCLNDFVKPLAAVHLELSTAGRVAERNYCEWLFRFRLVGSQLAITQ